MNISCITRDPWVDEKTLEAEPKEGTGGGGIVTKYLSFSKCCPNIHFTSDFGDPDLRPVVLIEPLAIRMRDVVTEVVADGKMEKLEQHKGVKLLWCEEQTVFRWSYEVQYRVFSLLDGLIASNRYQKQLLETLPFDLPVYTLYTPIDADLFHIVPKKKQIVVAAKVGLQKNTQAVIELFKRLPADIHKVYIGNAEMWGKVTYDVDKDLQKAVAEVADTYIKAASPIKTAEYIRESLVGINMSIYDVGSLSFLESGMSGCDFFAWGYHPMFDEYEHVTRFDTLADGLPKIIERFESLQPNTALQQEIAAKHSFEAFRGQLGNVIQEVFLNA